MLVRFPPNIFRKGNSDGEFLRELDKRVHYRERFDYCGFRVYENLFYNDQKISSDEIERVLGLICKKTGLSITPENTNQGFSVGFHVLYAADSQRQSKSVLMFLEDQLPEEYDFNRLSEVFMRSDNIERLVSCGLKAPTRNRGDYEY